MTFCRNFAKSQYDDYDLQKIEEFMEICRNIAKPCEHFPRFFLLDLFGGRPFRGPECSLKKILKFPIPNELLIIQFIISFRLLKKRVDEVFPSSPSRARASSLRAPRLTSSRGKSGWTLAERALLAKAGRRVEGGYFRPTSNTSSNTFQDPVRASGTLKIREISVNFTKIN